MHWNTNRLFVCTPLSPLSHVSHVAVVFRRRLTRPLLPTFFGHFVSCKNKKTWLDWCKTYRGQTILGLSCPWGQYDIFIPNVLNGSSARPVGADSCCVTSREATCWSWINFGLKTLVFSREVQQKVLVSTVDLRKQHRGSTCIFLVVLKYCV